jgi:hypothetical protein
MNSFPPGNRLRWHFACATGFAAGQSHGLGGSVRILIEEMDLFAGNEQFVGSVAVPLAWIQIVRLVQAGLIFSAVQAPLGSRASCNARQSRLSSPVAALLPRPCSGSMIRSNFASAF